MLPPTALVLWMTEAWSFLQEEGNERTGAHEEAGGLHLLTGTGGRNPGGGGVGWRNGGALPAAGRGRGAPGRSGRGRRGGRGGRGGGAPARVGAPASRAGGGVLRRAPGGSAGGRGGGLGGC